MDHIGIDVHKRESQICVLTPDGGVLEVRIATRRERFVEVLGSRSRAKVLIEASTESEWVARCLEACGHEVVVADPNFTLMYGSRSRRVKTDRRDARALAEACRSRTYREAHRRSDEQRSVNARLVVREALVRTRTRYIAVVRALLRGEGLRVPSGPAEHFVTRVGSMELPPRLLSQVAPLLAVMRIVDEQIEYCDAIVAQLGRQDEQIARLQTAPHVGPVTAAAFRAAVDDPKRFRGAHQLEAYLGLVPSELSSGEKQRRGHITKNGNTRVRWLLVQSAHGILRSKRASTLHLRQWAERIRLRRGTGVAVVALARKLAGVLFAIMRDETTYRTPLLATEYICAA